MEHNYRETVSQEHSTLKQIYAETLSGLDKKCNEEKCLVLQSFCQLLLDCIDSQEQQLLQSDKIARMIIKNVDPKIWKSSTVPETEKQDNEKIVESVIKPIDTSACADEYQRVEKSNNISPTSFPKEENEPQTTTTVESPVAYEFQSSQPMKTIKTFSPQEQHIRALRVSIDSDNTIVLANPTFPKKQNRASQRKKRNRRCSSLLKSQTIKDLESSDTSETIVNESKKIRSPSLHLRAVEGKKKKCWAVSEVTHNDNCITFKFKGVTEGKPPCKVSDEAVGGILVLRND